MICRFFTQKRPRTEHVRSLLFCRHPLNPGRYSTFNASACSSYGPLNPMHVCSWSPAPFIGVTNPMFVPFGVPIPVSHHPNAHLCPVYCSIVCTIHWLGCPINLMPTCFPVLPHQSLNLQCSWPDLFIYRPSFFKAPLAARNKQKNHKPTRNRPMGSSVSCLSCEDALILKVT